MEFGHGRVYIGDGSTWHEFGGVVSIKATDLEAEDDEPITTIAANDVMVTGTLKMRPGAQSKLVRVLFGWRTPGPMRRRMLKRAMDMRSMIEYRVGAVTIREIRLGRRQRLLELPYGTKVKLTRTKGNDWSYEIVEVGGQ